MALINCRECDKEISSEAVSCPHCGIANPAPKQAGNLLEKPCKKCSKPVSIFAATCHVCGVTSPTATTKDKVISIAVLVMVAFFAYAYFMDSSDDKAQQIQNSNVPSTQAPMQQVTPAIKPEDLIKFPRSAIACLSKDALQQAWESAAKGEKTKMLGQMLDESNPDGQCIMLNAKVKYKVISVENNNPNLPDAAILEVVGANITSANNGAYVLVLDQSMYTVVK